MDQRSSHICIKVKSDLEDSFVLSDYETKAETQISNDQIEKEPEICQTFASYGYCSAKSCIKLHDVDFILQVELVKKQQKKAKKQKINLNQIAKTSEAVKTIENNPILSENKIHNAGLDAFMTGFIMLSYVNKITKYRFDECIQKNITQSRFLKLNMLDHLDYLKFNVYITGKDYPLMIKKSNFSSYSQNHFNKKKRTTNTD
jgi:hypothetical protein